MSYILRGILGQILACWLVCQVVGARNSAGSDKPISRSLAVSSTGIDYIREIKDRQGEGAALGNLGNVYASLGNYTKAIEYHQQSLIIAREIHDRQSEGAEHD